MPRRARPPLPLLSSTIVANDEKLLDALNEVVLQTPGNRERRRKILRTQKTLKALSADEAWSVYLALEAAINERHDVQLTAVALWAFVQGVASRSRGEGS